MNITGCSFFTAPPAARGNPDCARRRVDIPLDRFAAGNRADIEKFRIGAHVDQYRALLHQGMCFRRQQCARVRKPQLLAPLFRLLFDVIHEEHYKYLAMTHRISATGSRFALLQCKFVG
jgi:hypothetical protein